MARPVVVGITLRPVAAESERLLVNRAYSDSLERAGAVPLGIPTLRDPPGGCRFHPRCPFAMDVCAQQAPPAFETGPGHRSACWLHAPQSSGHTPTNPAATTQGATGQADPAGEPEPGTDPAGRTATQ